MSYMLNQVLDSLFIATQAKHIELGLAPIDRNEFDKLRPADEDEIAVESGND